MCIRDRRNIGEYGKQNEKLMEDFKKFLRKNKLFTEETTILGIALDNPAFTPTNRLRYDVGPVSYTHLDVYKRQGYKREIEKRNKKIRMDYKHGKSLEELSKSYFLSIHSIRKIVYK